MTKAFHYNILTQAENTTGGDKKGICCTLLVVPVTTDYRLCSNYSTAPIIEPAMDFDFLFVLFMNHFKFGIIFLWCLANKNEFTKLNNSML